jgi:hypothetical protein
MLFRPLIKQINALKRLGSQLQASTVHTPSAVPPAPLTLKSTKFPAATATLPVTVHEESVATVQAIVVFAILPGVPCRSVTVTVLDCCENTLNCVTVQPFGTHVNTNPVSVALSFPLFTE